MDFFKKIIFLISFVIFSQNAVFAQVQAKKVGLQKVEFHSATRGSQQTIRLSNKGIIQEKTGISPSKKSRRVTPKQWQRYRFIVQQIDLKNIDKLPASNEKSKVDAAMVSQLIIKANGKIYKSPPFDDYDAPEALMPLMKTMVSQLRGK